MKIRSDKALQERLAEQLDMVSWHGHYFSCRCPFHEDSSPSMMVYEDYFKCLSNCGAHGSLQSLEKRLNKGNSTISHHTPASSENFNSPPWRSWLKKYGSYEDAAEAAHETALAMPSLVSYLKKRSIFEYLKQGKFGWIDNWLSFPVMDEEGSIVDWTIRAMPTKKIAYRYAARPRLSRNERHHLYVPDWKALQKADTVYACFGIVDVWALYKAGFPSCTGLHGKGIDIKLFDDIRKRVVVIPDKHEEPEGVKLVKELGWRGKLLRLDYPEDCKDPSDVLTIHGVNKLQSLITN